MIFTIRGDGVVVDSSLLVWQRGSSAAVSEDDLDFNAISRSYYCKERSESLSLTTLFSDPFIILPPTASACVLLKSYSLALLLRPL